MLNKKESMEIEIKHPNTSELFLLEINILENDGETIYKISFIDKRLSVSYGTVELRRKPNNFWKFPDKADNFLVSLLSESIFQIMNNEV
jgi:hypothetical protein